MKGTDDRSFRWLAFAVVAAIIAWLTGRVSPHMVNDTPSYLEYPIASPGQWFLEIRMPGYPLLLALVTATLGLSAMPLLQAVLHATASWALSEELKDRKMPMPAALIAGGCVLIGCTAMDHINTISTDAPAASLGVLTAVLLMRGCRTTRWWDWAGCGALALCAIFFRPAYLYLIPWIAIAGWLLSRHDQAVITHRMPKHACYFGAATASVLTVLLLGWMAARKVAVNEFGLLPFGHHNLSALLVQTVPTNTLDELPGPGGELARVVAAEMKSNGFETLDGPTDTLSTMTIERQWDDINYHIITPGARRLEESREDEEDPFMVRVHKRIAAMNGEILGTSPKGYLRWIALGVRRAAWGVAANIVMHPVFLAIILIGSVLVLGRCTTGTPITPIVIPAGWSALAVVGFSYAVCNIGFVILSSPPLGRFADAGAIFLPGLAACLLAQPQRSSLDRATRRMLQSS